MAHRKRTRDHAKERAQRTLKDPLWNRRQKLARRYGISLDHYATILHIQKGRCAICRRRPRETLSVDHCHKDRVIRGLLCHACNLGLGKFEDKVKRLKAAIIYLTKSVSYGKIEVRPLTSRRKPHTS